MLKKFHLTHVVLFSSTYVLLKSQDIARVQKFTQVLFFPIFAT